MEGGGPPDTIGPGNELVTIVAHEAAAQLNQTNKQPQGQPHSEPVAVSKPSSETAPYHSTPHFLAVIWG